jgi:hypothetical protein
MATNTTPSSDFAISKFKTNLAQGGARPSLFSVTLTYPSEITNSPTKESKFFVKGTTIPASTIGSFDVFYNGKAIKVAGDRSFDTWETTIINDEDFGIRIAIEQWMDLIAEHKLNTRSNDFTTKEGENSLYKRDIKVTQFKKNGEEAWHYHFIGAFPTALSTIALDWGTQEIEEYTCTWTYDRWMPGTAPHLLQSDSHNN